MEVIKCYGTIVQNMAIYWGSSIAWKVSKYGVSSDRYFPVPGLNAGKYEPEKTLYLDTFHAQQSINNRIEIDLYEFK